MMSAIHNRPSGAWMSSKICVHGSTIHGKGLQAVQPIAAGETVLIWATGYTDRAGVQAAIQQGKGVMQWDEDVFSYDTGDDDSPYSINHSCDPNTWMADAYTIVARRAISPGEEVTVDYGLWEGDPEFISSWICRCGSADCRGRITGKDWQDPVLQTRYAGHFSPLINGWIRGAG